MSNIIERIKDKKVHSVFRIANLFCINFGEEVANKLDEDDDVKHPEISFRMNCPWRIYKDGEVMLATGDVFEAYSEDVGDEWNFNAMGRADGESSLFDVNIKFIEKHVEGLTVESLEILEPVKDIRITLSDGTVVDGMISSSRKREFWKITDFAEGNVVSYLDK